MNLVYERNSREPLISKVKGVKGREMNDHVRDLSRGDHVDHLANDKEFFYSKCPKRPLEPKE